MRRDDLRAVAALVAVWLAAVVLVDPRADVPIIDDWCYAVSVEGLLHGAGLRVSPWSSTFPPVQLLWGALFAWLGGFSFTSLRLSTLVIWLAGTLGSYGGLRALGRTPGMAIFGALTFFLHPVAFVLAFSFMSDIPFVACSALSLWALVTGLRAADERTIVTGLVLALVAFLVRPVAIALPAGLFLGAFALAAPTLRRRAAALALLTIVLMILTSTMLVRFFPWAGEGGVQYRVARLSYILLVSPLIYLEAGLSMLAHVGLVIAPVLLMYGPAPGRRTWTTAAVLVAAAVVVSRFVEDPVSAVKFAHTMSFEELGAARPLLQGFAPRGSIARLLALVATGVGLLGAAALLARVADGLRPRGWLRRPEWACVAGFALASIGLCFVLWFFYDRYYLPLVLAAVMLAFGDADVAVAAWRRRLAVAVLAFLAVVDVTGTRDMLAFARAVTTTAAELRATGIPEMELDAGYVENGWRLYAHPERLPAGKTPAVDVPHVTASAEGLRWVIADGPLPGYRAVREITIPTWWASTDRIYVLEKSGT